MLNSFTVLCTELSPRSHSIPCQLTSAVYRPVASTDFMCGESVLPDASLNADKIVLSVAQSLDREMSTEVMLHVKL